MGLSSGKPPSPLSIRSLTWHKQSHQLFDYESHNYLEENILSGSQGFIVKHNQSVKWSRTTPMPDDVLLTVQEEGSTVKVAIRTSQGWQDDKIRVSPQQGYWMVAKNSCPLAINEQDEIKLGRIFLTVRQIVPSGGRVTTSSDNAPLFQQHPIEEEDCAMSYCSGETDKSQCRVCFSRQSSSDNPLISPCRCSGSLLFIHLKCLQEWVAQKVQKRMSQRSLCYRWNKSKCQICHETFTDMYEKEGKRFSLYKIDWPNDQPYIMIETVKKTENGIKRATYICALEEGREIKIGRDSDSDIKINDVSVSRKHATLVMRSGKVVIQDCRSKFGTLLRFNKPVSLSAEELWLQRGRNLLILSRQTYFVSACCSCAEDTRYEITVENLHKIFGHVESH